MKTITAIATLGLSLSLVNPIYASDDESSKFKRKPKAREAVAMVVSCTDNEVRGTAFLREEPSEEGVKEIDITLVVKGLTPGKHAVHVHERGLCEAETRCGSAGGHFDPGPASFSSPDGNHPFHLGDLNNIDINKLGFGVLKVKTTRFTLTEGPISVLDDDGSAFIIHTLEDTYCPDGAVAACAGGTREACAVIVPQ